MKHETFTDRNKLLRYVGISFVFLLFLQYVLYYAIFSNIANFMNNFGWWILYLDISVVTIAGALWYYSSYKGFTSCMASMMIGMTFGMQTGMMIGAVFGAVNGFFIGAMIGMLLGTFIGAVTGKSKISVMGIMQGAMSGIMGGTMGAMITFMMFADHVLVFMPFYMLLNVAILYGFAQMYHDEVIKDNKEVVKNQLNLYGFVALTVFVGLILTAILVYAPKSVLFGFGG